MLSFIHTQAARRDFPARARNAARGLRCGLIALVALLAAADARRADAAPQYALSGRADELASLILAEDSEGPVSALEVLVYLDMAALPQARLPVAHWLAPPEARDPGIWKLIEAGIAEYLAVRSLARSGSSDGFPPYLRRALTYSSYQAAWIDTVIIQPASQIVVLETDVNRYFIANAAAYTRPREVQVRYIFFPLPEGAPPTPDLLEPLQRIRDQIARGELTFEAAATRHSRAEARSQGGLIPPFPRGTHFLEFEYQAFSLNEPGAMSPVFFGKGGVYLLRLERNIEPVRRPVREVEIDIRKTLRAEHVPHYYNYLLSELASGSFFRDRSIYWPWAELDAPVALLDGRQLTRKQVIEASPGVVSADYEVRWNLLNTETGRWREGEIIRRDAEERGIGGHRYIKLGEAVAERFLRARDVAARSVDRSAFLTEEGMRSALGITDPAAPLGIRQSRVVRVDVMLALGDPKVMQDPEFILPEDIRRTLEETSFAVEQGVLPLEGGERVPFVGLLGEAAARGKTAMETAIADLNSRAALDGPPSVRVSFIDLDWKDSFPIIAWQPFLADLPEGGVSGPGWAEGGRSHFAAVAVRYDAENPWLTAPVVLQSLMFDLQARKRLDEEILKVREMKLMNFESFAPPAEADPDAAVPDSGAES